MRRRHRGYRVPLRRRLRSVVRRAPRTDGLTGLRTGLALERDLTKLVRQTPLSLVVFDVDGLKRIGDLYGHAAGDAVLRELAEIVQDEATKREARSYRCGGDRFALLLRSASGSEASDAEEAAQAVRRRFADTTINLDGCAEPIRKLTVIAGGSWNRILAFSRAHGQQGMNSLLQQAFIEVGKAKEAGGNCVRVRL